MLETKRLTLKLPTLEDAPFFLELLNDPAFIRNVADRGVRTVAESAQYMKDRVLSSFEKSKLGFYVVELKETKTPIGICGLVKRDFLKYPDIGFAFLPKYLKQGYAYEASQAVMNYAKNELKLEKVLGVTLPTNTDSIRLLEKLGLRHEGKTVQMAPNEPACKLFTT